MNELHVIIPTYNRADKIIETIESVICAAKKFKFTITIIDNASTDGTENLIRSKYKELMDKKRIYLLCYDVNVPMVENWNRCISSIEDACYTKLLWSDDCLDANYFTKKIKIMNELNCDIVGCNLRTRNIETSVIRTRSYGGKFARITSLFRNSIGYPSTLLFRTNALEGRLFDERIPYAADIDLVLNQLKDGMKLHHMDCSLVEAKQDGSTETSKFFGSRLMMEERKKFRSKHINPAALRTVANILDKLVMTIFTLSKIR